jgi:hypothetical protein
MMSLFDGIAISAGATVGALTFANLYDHMLDEIGRHTKKALRRIHKLTAAEIERLNALRDQSIASLESMPLGSLTAA